MQNAEAIRAQITETMHNEHCSYKSTRRDLAGLYTSGDHVIQGPGENAGIVRLGGGLALALRMESHNHPSAVEPFQGATTGVGGIIRDIITMGAKPIALVDMLRFGTNDRALEIREGVVAGIADYGNTIGIPIIGGDVFFDETYNGNPLVNVACMGIVEERNIMYGHALTPGNDLIYVGGRTGLDGVGGSDFASKSFGKDSTGEKEAIQKGDPFLEKLLLEACVELAPTGWVEGMQDMGAAGVLCSTTEIAHRGQRRTGLPIGTRVYLNRIPLKVNVQHMTPTQLLLSESQERMMIVGKREYRDEILDVFKHWDLEATVVGDVTNDGNYTLVYSENGEEQTTSMPISEICGDFYQDWPRRQLVRQDSVYIKAPKHVTSEIWHQYDWRVGTRTIKGPNQSGHYAVLDLGEIGKDLVVSWSSDEGRSDRDPIEGITYAFTKAYRHIVRRGATALGLTNCLNFGHPDAAMGAFSQTTRRLADICEMYQVPVISGNVSLYNETNGRSIKPTPMLVMVGIRDKK